MKRSEKFWWSMGVIVVYILICNWVPSMFMNNQEQNMSDDVQNGMVKISIGNSVDVQIVRNHFYGVEYIHSSENSNSDVLYLFWMIPIPLKINHFDMILIHGFFLIGIFCYWLYLGLDYYFEKSNKFIKMEKEEEKWKRE